MMSFWQRAMRALRRLVKVRKPKRVPRSMGPREPYPQRVQSAKCDPFNPYEVRTVDVPGTPLAWTLFYVCPSCESVGCVPLYQLGESRCLDCRQPVRPYVRGDAAVQ